MRLPTLLAALLAVAGCGDDSTPPVDMADLGTPPDLAPVGMQVRESVEQLMVTHATPGHKLVLVDGTGATVQTGTADKLGSYIFRKVPPASGYVIKEPDDGVTSRALTVMSVASSQPSPDFYAKQQLHAGFQYITTRDGTTLSIYVTMPGPESMGPYPTVVDYSGYEPSQPGAPIDGGKYSFLCDQLPSLCDAPNDPSALLASLFDYATVSVNIRGTGCSGGAYDFFETLQLLDGYDVIETVAAQPWVLHNHVGMTGLSYPGISQLFVAQTNPPHLAAITPLSVIGNTTTTLIPGGILNDGFAQQWITEVLSKADPYGQGWEMMQVQTGDGICKENQLLHGQKVDNVQEAKDYKNLTHALLDPIDPTLFAPTIKVPVFLAGAWQDEQTGPFFTTLLNQFKSSPLVRETVYNGIHPDGFQPDVLAEWHDFLELYVAERTPVTPKPVRDLAPVLFDNIYNSPQRLPPDRFPSTMPYAQALAMYQAEPQLRVLWESGAGDPSDWGAPMPTYETHYAAWPPPSTQVERLFLHADGSASNSMPTESAAALAFQLDPAAGERGILQPGGDVWDKLPAYDWEQPQPGKAIVFETAALDADQVMLGNASADLWIKSTANDADLQVTVTEVRPDGNEMYVQSGWLRASMRELAPDSTDLFPDVTDIYADAQPLVPGQWTSVRVPVAAFGHVFRKGSKIRIIVDTPGGTRAAWRFQLATFPGPVTHDIGVDATHPSSIALPLLPGESIPTQLPPCPSLRGQQCRKYMSYADTPAQ